ncbi:MAG TPA: ATP-binding protein [Solirubrobacteraceae bacterium]|nr:ATP-binding protein [Solirubrobacteraceae bacterium]
MSSPRLERHALARPDELAGLRTAVWRYAMDQGASQEVAQAVRLAVGEALTNVVMHAYVGRDSGAMTVKAWVDDDDHLNVEILDEGHGLIPRADSPGLGLGMGLMAQMADDLRITNREGHPGTSVCLRFSLAESQELCGCGAAP